MKRPLALDELSTLMKTCAGLSVDAKELRDRPDTTFAELGLDSLGLLGIVGALENQYGAPISAGTETSKTPGEFIDLVNSSITAGA